MSDRAPPVTLHDGHGFRAVTELAPDFVAVVDVAGFISYVSPAIQRVMGYLPREIIGSPFLALVLPDDQPRAREDWARLLASDDIIEANLRYRHKDGSFRVLETLAKNYSSTPGVRGVLVSTRDITQRIAHEEALQSALEEISDLYNNAPCGLHSLDENGLVVRINDTELRWLGRTRDEVVGILQFPDLLSLASRPIFERCFPVFLARGWVDNIELELVRKDGTVMPVLLNASAITGEEGQFVMSRSTLYDISERRLAESALRRLNRAYRVLSAVNSELIHAEEEPALLQNICQICVELGGYRMAWVGFVQLDAAKTVNPAAGFGVEAGYLEGAAISWAKNARGRGPTGLAIRTGQVQVNRDFLTNPHMAPWRDDALQRGYRSSVALPLKDASGSIGALMLYATDPDAFDVDEIRLLEEAASDLAFGILTLRARERHRHAEKKIEHLAFFDQLTGLPNRNSLLDALGQATERLQTSGGQLALLNLNIVRFNDIQSGIGVREADELLCQLASRLQQALHEDELLARIGGDEFSVLLPDAGSEHAKACARRFEQALIPPFQQAGIPISVQVRTGAAVAPADGVEPEVLLLHSGIAARQARRRGDLFALYGGWTEAETPRHLVFISELRSAIEARQLILHYQPRVDMGKGRIAGAEALVRWQHPERGLISPGQFIEIAEQTGLIRPLTHCVLDAALQQCSIWSTEGFVMPVAVNVSVNNFNDPDFLRQVEELLQKWDVPAELLQLEITESVLMEEPAQTLDLLIRLKDRGISVSIDDFGTGYSSLSYIAGLPIQTLKIDRSFVIQMAGSARTCSVVSATIALAHSLGIKTVAEGVETIEQVKTLIAMDCNEIQGFFFSRPVDADTLRQWTTEFSLESYALHPGCH